jgi:hypothetical protein
MASARNPAEQFLLPLILPNLSGAIINVCCASVVEYFAV